MRPIVRFAALAAACRGDAQASAAVIAPVLPRAPLEPGYLKRRIVGPSGHPFNHMLSATLFVRL